VSDSKVRQGISDQASVNDLRQQGHMIALNANGELRSGRTAEKLPSIPACKSELVRYYVAK
jgi:hypothetical protein